MRLCNHVSVVRYSPEAPSEKRMALTRTNPTITEVSMTYHFGQRKSLLISRFNQRYYRYVTIILCPYFHFLSEYLPDIFV